MKSLGVYIPSVYLESDADGSTAAFITAFDTVHEELIAAIELIPTVNQPRNAPLGFLEMVAAHHGNPFPFMTAERWQEANKSENLSFIYTIRGAKASIENVIRYLCGIEVVLLQDFEYCWELGISRLGLNPVNPPGFGVSFGTYFGS